MQNIKQNSSIYWVDNMAKIQAIFFGGKLMLVNLILKLINLFNFIKHNISIQNNRK